MGPQIAMFFLCIKIKSEYRCASVYLSLAGTAADNTGRQQTMLPNIEGFPVSLKGFQIYWAVNLLVVSGFFNFE